MAGALGHCHIKFLDQRSPLEVNVNLLSEACNACRQLATLIFTIDLPSRRRYFGTTTPLAKKLKLDEDMQTDDLSSSSEELDIQSNFFNGYHFQLQLASLELNSFRNYLIN